MQKTWLGIAVVIGLSLVLGLAGILFRILRTDYALQAQLELTNQLAERGLEVANNQGCIACHSLNGTPGIGPTWRGMYGRTETLKDGSTVVVDADYIRESILRPGAKVVAEFENIMLQYPLPDEDIEALVEFSRQLSQP